MTQQAQEWRLVRRPRGYAVPEDVELVDVDGARTAARRGAGAQPVRLGRPVHARPDERRRLLRRAVPGRQGDVGWRGRPGAGVRRRALPGRRRGPARQGLAHPRRGPGVASSSGSTRGRAAAGLPGRARHARPDGVGRAVRHRPGAPRGDRLGVGRVRRGRRAGRAAGQAGRLPGDRQRGRRRTSRATSSTSSGSTPGWTTGPATSRASCGPPRPRESTCTSRTSAVTTCRPPCRSSTRSAGSPPAG